MKTQKKLTIGLFTDDFFGGIVRSVEVQATELARMGHRVIIFAPWLPFEQVPKGCEFQPVKFLWHKRLAGYMGFLSWSNKTAAQITNSYSFDIIHSHNERGSMFLCAKLAKKTGVPHIHTFHSNYAGTHAGSPFVAALDSIFYIRAALLLLHFLSKKTRPLQVHLPKKSSVVEQSAFARYDWRTVAQLAQYFDAYTSPASFLVDIVNECTDGALKNKGYFIANGISPVFNRAKRSRALTEPIWFMLCGRLDPEKRAEVALRAFAALQDTTAELHIIGNGSQSEFLKTLAIKLGVASKVKFLGQLDNRKQIATQYANADVFLFPSYHFETQGLVLGEAACTGEAIIYCDERLAVGVTKNNSLLIKPTVNAFTEAMEKLIKNKTKVRKMQSASIALRPSLSPTTMANKMNAVYNNILNK